MTMTSSKKILKIAKGEVRENSVWFMRQSGRYLPDYRVIKGNRKFSDMMQDRTMIQKLTTLPLKYFPTDALVIFTDILMPFFNMGYQVSYEGEIKVTEGRGDSFDYYRGLSEAINKIQSSYNEKTIMGVVGGPFTTLSYLGDSRKNGYPETKAKIISDDHKILNKLVEEIIEFAGIQAKSGVDIIQIFESWIGSVSESFYDKHLENIERYFMEKICQFGKPVIFFSEGSFHLFNRLLKLEADVYSLDWRSSLTSFKAICPDCVVQGNLDPYLLAADDLYLKSEVKRIMREGKSFPGHIFNLGHGVPPWADYRKLNLITNEVLNYE